MVARRALLDPADMQSCRGELHLIPAQVHQFGDAQAMPVGHKDHGGVPVSPAVALCRSHQPLDFGFGQVLAGAQVAIGRPPGRNCSVYGGPRDEPEVPFGHVFHPSRIDACSYNTHYSNSLQAESAILKERIHAGLNRARVEGRRFSPY